MENPRADEARNLPPESYSMEVDNHPSTLWQEALADRAAGRPCWSTRGASDIPADERQGY